MTTRGCARVVAQVPFDAGKVNRDLVEESGGVVLYTIRPHEFSFQPVAGWAGEGVRASLVEKGAPFSVALVLWQSPAAAAAPFSPGMYSALQECARSALRTGAKGLVINEAVIPPPAVPVSKFRLLADSALPLCDALAAGLAIPPVPPGVAAHSVAAWPAERWVFGMAPAALSDSLCLLPVPGRARRAFARAFVGALWDVWSAVDAFLRDPPGQWAAPVPRAVRASRVLAGLGLSESEVWDVSGPPRALGLGAARPPSPLAGAASVAELDRC